jgi:hypothetical protein
MQRSGLVSIGETALLTAGRRFDAPVYACWASSSLFDQRSLLVCLPEAVDYSKRPERCGTALPCPPWQRSVNYPYTKRTPWVGGSLSFCLPCLFSWKRTRSCREPPWPCQAAKARVRRLVSRPILPCSPVRARCFPLAPLGSKRATAYTVASRHLQDPKNRHSVSRRAWVGPAPRSWAVLSTTSFLPSVCIGIFCFLGGFARRRTSHATLRF